MEMFSITFNGGRITSLNNGELVIHNIAKRIASGDLQLERIDTNNTDIDNTRAIIEYKFDSIVGVVADSNHINVDQAQALVINCFLGQKKETKLTAQAIKDIEQIRKSSLSARYPNVLKRANDLQSKKQLTDRQAAIGDESPAKSLKSKPIPPPLTRADFSRGFEQQKKAKASLPVALAKPLNKTSRTKTASLPAWIQKSPLGSWNNISSNFSPSRQHPVYNINRAHEGVDLVASLGTAVRPPYSGIVDAVGWIEGYGRVVRVSVPDFTLLTEMQAF